jgi:hypothetical protein
MGMFNTRGRTGLIRDGISFCFRHCAEHECIIRIR